MANKVYFWDKLGSSGTKSLLGECQIGNEGFNMSFVIDGTKDSAKLQVISFSISEVVKPYTIIYHEDTQTWWIVSNDKVERIINDSGDFIYIHNLQLEGAVELLNARDLTTCAFNQKRYTIRNVIYRLFQLSNFELPIAIEVNTNLDIDKIVDYIKTYENYTLLSALRDFFDGYNCAVKVYFTANGSSPYYLKTLNIKIISKTGNVDRTIKTFDEVFVDVKETKSMNKGSHGTTVVSNAENVVSTVTKTFPNVGATRISGTEHTITPSSAIIRLPSPVFKVNRVDMICKLGMRVWYSTSQFGDGEVFYFDIIPEDDENLMAKLKTAISTLKSYNQIMVTAQGTLFDIPIAEFEDRVNNDFLSIQNQILEQARVRLYNDVSYNPIDDTFSSEHGLTSFQHLQSGTMKYKQYVLVDSETRDCLAYPYQGMYFKRGESYIKGFDFFGEWGTNNTITSTRSALSLFYSHVGTDYYLGISVGIVTGSGDAQYDPYQMSNKLSFRLNDTRFVVEYIPMTNIKIKYDNDSVGHDIQLYNQNGKLTDCNALSKLLCSYKKEIESDNITRYTIGYDFTTMPKVGDIIKNSNNEKYVINNVSLDFFQNEKYENGKDYFLVGEITLSKNIATKSLLVNPNTNIRDYGIPQNNNVSRKQLYRDFYELSHVAYSDRDYDYYLKLYEVLNLTNKQKQSSSHTTVAKITFANNDTYYYQLESTAYCFKKSYYEVVEFQDNNIIGYGNQNISTGFNVQRVFDGTIDMINTPISYVDDNGEFTDIRLAFCNNEEITTLWYNWRDSLGYGNNYRISLYNYSCFVPAEIYEGSNSGRTQLYKGSAWWANAMWIPDRVEITNYLNGYTGPASDISFGGMTLTDIVDRQGTYGTDYTYQIVKENGRYYVEFTALTVLGSGLCYVVITDFYRAGYDGAKDRCDFLIDNDDYNKDALEVPVFEYCCQIDDSDDVIVGENILDSNNDAEFYLYSYKLVEKGKYDENNCYSLRERPTMVFNDLNQPIISVQHGVVFECDNTQLKISCVNGQSFNLINETLTNGSQITITTPFTLNDIMIYRHKITRDTTYETINGVKYVKSDDDMMMIIRNTQSMVVSANKIQLCINHYKLK